MRCALIYNPAAGGGSVTSIQRLRQAADLLFVRGHEVHLISTTAPGSAKEQASEAVAQGANIVFACGGDGTVHEVLQGLVSEVGNPRGCLGILPTGSANALARHLKIPLDPLQAALRQIEGEPVLVPVGKIIFDSRQRYFSVMAGAGPAGELAYQVLVSHKSVLGRTAYYVHAARLFTTRRFPSFEISYRIGSSEQRRTMKAVSVMVVRVTDMGGLFHGVAGHSGSIRDPNLKILAVAPPAVISLPLWFLSGWLHLHRINPFLCIEEVTELSICAGEKMYPHLEADGEWIGRGSMSLSLVPNALRIRLPSQVP